MSALTCKSKRRSLMLILSSCNKHTRMSDTVPPVMTQTTVITWWPHTGEPAAMDHCQSNITASLYQLDHISMTRICYLLSIDLINRLRIKLLDLNMNDEYLDDDIALPDTSSVTGTTSLDSLDSGGLVTAECQTIASIVLVDYQCPGSFKPCWHSAIFDSWNV